MIATLAATALGAQFATAARDYISVVGSSTVYPFSTVVAERFGKSTNYKTPKIESTGTGGGMKLFCQGVGVANPDITNASRRIKSSEFEMCQKNGVRDIIEVLIGYDGIVIGNSVESPQLDLTLKELFLALAAEVPNPDGSETLVKNPYKTWKDINPTLPNYKIEVLGPPPTSGTRDAFQELALEGGCDSIAWIKALKDSDKDLHKKVCRTVREDGPFIEAGENDNLIVQKLNANKRALGIFGFSFLDQNSDKIQGSLIGGNPPEFETIADGSYPVSRPLYFYVKKDHIGTIPGMQEYLAEFTSEAAFGEEGYLSEKGMIPLGDAERAKVANAVKTLQSMSM
ncbi:MAG: PstS family phosphate ABC transporter substrate-binding protein [Gammaproteobacteria bacterium]|nr:PstS family phosphate ABC transporter substrate-binding protein [Pseudomaricurvus alcaniphilus]MBR9909930.1 PstS family phosphate ABC transporter substrate-binding protein [Gammaproteobacteria bacterium]NHN38852.1 PstS family phosphate ABC transporter substrate-binding protein [Pseudomaricurvus alcaniphilus]